MDIKLNEKKIREIHYKINDIKTAIILMDEDGIKDINIVEKVSDAKFIGNAVKNIDKIEELKKEDKTVSKINKIISLDDKLDEIAKKNRNLIANNLSDNKVTKISDTIDDFKKTEKRLKSYINDLKEEISSDISNGNEINEKLQELKLKENDLVAIQQTIKKLINERSDAYRTWEK